MSWLVVVNGGIISGVVLWFFKGRITQLIGITGKVKDDQDFDAFDAEEGGGFGAGGASDGGGGWQSSGNDSMRPYPSTDSAYPRPRYNKQSDTQPHDASYQVRQTIHYNAPKESSQVFYPPPPRQAFNQTQDQAQFPPPPQFPRPPPPVYSPIPKFPPPPYQPKPKGLPSIPQYAPPPPQYNPAYESSDWHQPLPSPGKVTVKKGAGSKNTNVDQIDPSELELGEILGGGSFGLVHKGKWHGTLVAVKVLKVNPGLKAQGEVEALEEFHREVAMLSRLRHPNICLFMGCCLKEGQHTIVTELIGRGSLWDVLREPKLGQGMQGEWSWERVRQVARGIACGMAYLHGTKPHAVLHRDLKSSNILCDESYCPKICDFGLSRLKAHVHASSIMSTRLNQAAMTGNCGTIQWMAPEVLANQSYSETADVYSFGIILWELLARECPYDGTPQVSVALSVVQHGSRPVIPQCPLLYRQLIETCWSQDASRRPSFKRLLEEETIDKACQLHKQSQPPLQAINSIVPRGIHHPDAL